MKYLRQLLLIFLFSFLGELLHSLISWPIPASIYGMVLLFIALSLRIVKLEHIKTTGDALVSLLPVLFVAPIVSLLDCWDIIRPHLVPIVLILLVSSVVCFAVSGWSVQALMKGKGKEGPHD